MTFRKYDEHAQPPDQREARRVYGDAVIDEMIANPPLNARCWSCGEHHGLVCVCSRAEKRAAYDAMVARRATIRFSTYQGK